eukprot:symbB.v1.2.019535.t4/scaffold1599.1/size109767/5
MSAEVSDTGRTESDQDELGDASAVAEGKAESATEGVRPSTCESTCAGSGAESLEETFGSSASKEYTFGSSHSVQMASSTPGSPNGSGAGLPPKPKGLPPLGAPKPKRTDCQCHIAPYWNCSSVYAMALDEASLRRYLDEAVNAAQQAGNLMLECFGRNDAHAFVEEKTSAADLVTKYDRQVEDLVLARLRKCAPEFRVVAEETASKEELTDAPTWVVDPIDGTTNFIHRQAECCVLIGLAVQKRCVLGVCFIPKMDELYTAIKGHGAFCNGRRISSSGCEDLTKALVNLHLPSYSRGPKVVDRILGITRDLLAHPVRGIRCGGSAGVDMMHVARGRLDAYFEVGIYPWDVCAGSIIVEEAGGVCVDTLGGDFDLSSRRVLVASSKALGKELAIYLQQRRYDTVDAENYDDEVKRRRTQ